MITGIGGLVVSQLRQRRGELALLACLTGSDAWGDASGRGDRRLCGLLQAADGAVGDLAQRPGVEADAGAEARWTAGIKSLSAAMRCAVLLPPATTTHALAVRFAVMPLLARPANTSASGMS